MSNCGQVCIYNTLYGCKVKEYNAICPLTNMAPEFEPTAMTNADRIRDMSDEEQKDSILAVHLGYSPWCDHHCENEGDDGCDRCIGNWLQQPAEEVPANG